MQRASTNHPSKARVAFVTGVSRGLGEAIAMQLVAAGWHVTGIGRSAAPALAGAGFEWLRADLGDLHAATTAALAAMRAAAAATPSRALLVNNAAVAGPVGSLGTMDAAELAASLAVNLVAPTALANAFCAAFADVTVERRIVNVSSGLAGRAMTGAALYSIAKCGMEMLTRALAVDHPEASFAAVTYRPGIIDTPMQAYMRTRPASELPDVAMFGRWHADGELVPPARVAATAIAHLVDGAIESGRTYNYAELAASAPGNAAGEATSRSQPASSSREP
ncbi:MAG TPA: SDR family NAD(P)-dependent oxidoreductase [Casimicrobiaceae bacterium]|nr:SDR family NAD(P)-dependent oxidoreductase [Casimicrobiaceae bacterium]